MFSGIERLNRDIIFARYTTPAILAQRARDSVGLWLSPFSSRYRRTGPATGTAAGNWPAAPFEKICNARVRAFMPRREPR